MVRFIVSLARSIYQREPWWAEGASGIGILGWFVIMGTSSAGMDERATFAYLIEAMGEMTWIRLGFLMGALQIACLLTDIRWGRWMLAFMCGWFWCVIAKASFLAIPTPPAAAVYATMAGVNIYSVLRLPRRFEINGVRG